MAQMGEHEVIGESSVEETFRGLLHDLNRKGEGIGEKDRDGERKEESVRERNLMLMEYAVYFHDKLQEVTRISQRDIKALKAQNKYLEQELKIAKQEMEIKPKDLEQKKEESVEFSPYA